MIVDPLTCLDRSVFAAWLAAHGDQVVGTVADEQECPLGRYVLATTGYQYTVSWLTIAPVGGLGADCLPDWAVAFVVALDSTYPQQDVTGAQALAVLETCGEVPPFPADAVPGDPAPERDRPVYAAASDDVRSAFLLGLLLGLLFCWQYTFVPLIVVFFLHGQVLLLRV